MVSTGELRQAKREPIFHPTSNGTPTNGSRAHG
jgi:hypothetical protein